MNKKTVPLTRLLTACAALALTGAAWSHGDHEHGAHVHGVATLHIVIDKDELELEFETPLDSLLGFERAPRGDKEKQAAAAVLKHFREAASVFSPEAAAGCRRTKTEVEADRIDPKVISKGGEHADLEAEYEFRCADLGKLTRIDSDLFAKYPRLQRIDVQVVAPQGQYTLQLKRPDGVIQLRR